ncbi:hypothetical protein IJI72_02195 [Candidatus Saccharibacteria bacterium]|nr:hypothetical protein [Candidatus Saccharibacteria bacterium]
MNNSQEPGVISNVSYDAPAAPVFGSGNSVKSPKETAPASSKSPSKKSILLICLVALLLISGGVAGFFLYRHFKTKTSDDPENLVTVTYTTPADSEDPEGDYLAYLKENTAKAKKGIDKVSALTQEASQYISMGDLESARATLDSINESDLKTNEEKYTYYNAYGNLYDVDALNDPKLCAEYRQKADEITEIMDNEAMEQMRESYAAEDDE